MGQTKTNYMSHWSHVSHQSHSFRSTGIQPPRNVFRRPYQRLAIIRQRAFNPLTWNQDQIQPGGDLMLTESECLAQQTLQAIAAHSRTVLLRNTQSDPRVSQIVTIAKDQQVLVTAATLPRVDPFKVGPATDMLSRAKVEIHHADGVVGGSSWLV